MSTLKSSLSTISDFDNLQPSQPLRNLLHRSPVAAFQQSTAKLWKNLNMTIGLCR